MNVELSRLTVLLPAEYAKSATLQHHIAQKQFASLPISKDIAANFYTHLFYWFGQIPKSNLPLAALAALAAGLATADGAWLFADPIQLQVDLSHVYAFGNQHLQLSNDEVTQLVNEINTFLTAENFKIYAVNEFTWLMHLPSDPNIITTPLAEIIGKNLQNYLPRGEQQRFWQTLLTEIQMLMYQSEINQRRERQGLPMANSLWFWGEGSLQDLQPRVELTGIFTGDIVATGLAKFTHTPCFQMPMDFVQLDIILQQKPGNYLLAIAEEKQAENFMKQWLQPLIKAVQDKKLSFINFDICQENGYQINYRRFNLLRKIFEI